jgi:hypothetical protein
MKQGHSVPLIVPYRSQLSPPLDFFKCSMPSYCEMTFKLPVMRKREFDGIGKAMIRIDVTPCRQALNTHINQFLPPSLSPALLESRNLLIWAGMGAKWRWNLLNNVMFLLTIGFTLGMIVLGCSSSVMRNRGLKETGSNSL